MPTLLFINGLRFFFYSNESNEPAHIHITKGGASGKVWLEPAVEIAYLHGFINSEEKDILKIIEIHSQDFKTKWHEYFSK
jgi:hypothetical protein